MRQTIRIFDQLNRPTNWITQEVIEEYVGARIKGPHIAEIVLTRLCSNDATRYHQFMQCVAVLPELDVLEQELIEEFGEEYFIGPPLSKERFIRHLEDRLLKETNNDIAAKLSKELREARGWVIKPSEQNTKVEVLNLNGGVKFDKSNPAEAEKLYFAIAGAALSR